MREEIIIDVRFHEVDSLSIVWHSHYLSYFEVAREAFGDRHGVGYTAMKSHGIIGPIVHVECQYKLPLQYGDQARVSVSYQPTKAAKMNFQYKIFRHASDELVAEGKTSQVFVDVDSRQLILNYPDFFKNWLATSQFQL